MPLGSKTCKNFGGQGLGFVGYLDPKLCEVMLAGFLGFLAVSILVVQESAR